MIRHRFVVTGLVSGVLLLVAAARADAAETRPEPLRDLQADTVLYVTDFGATPDDGKDDLPAIQATIEKARGIKEPVRIVLGPGRFDLHPTGDRGPALRIVNQHDLLVDGDGAELVMHNPKMGLMNIAVSRRVIVRNLSVDYAPLPMTQGWVRAVDVANREFEVEFLEGFDLPDREHFVSAQVRWGIFKDRNAPRALKPGSHNMCPLNEWWKVGPRRFRYRTEPWYPMETIAPGDPFVHIARTNGAPLVAMWQSEDVTLDRVRVFASPGAGFVAQLSSRVNLLGVHVGPAEGRWQCLNADGFYCIANRVGPWVEGCVFDATGDDCIVVKTWGANCAEKLGPRTLLLQPRETWSEGTHAFAVEQGDTIRVCDPTRCEQVAQFTVVAVELVPRVAGQKPAWRVTADRDLDNITPGTDRRDPIYFNDDITSGNFVVRDNILRNIRRWGLLCMSHDGLIEHNTFQRTSAQAILLTSNDAGFRDSDGFVARNITIRDNIFEDCYTERTTKNRDEAAAIASVVIAGAEREYQADIVDWRGHESIVINGNRFIDSGLFPAISLGNVNGATVRDNRFEVRPGRGATPRIRIARSADVTLTGNRQQGQAPTIDVDTATTEDISIQ